MKIQCACGTKYSFDITPEMARTPIQLVCQNCGRDNSAAVNQIIQQQFGVTVTTPAPASRPQTPPPVVIVPPPPGVRIAASPSATPAGATVTATNAGPVASPAPPVPSAPALRVSLATHTATPPASGTTTSTTPAASAAELCAKHSGQTVVHRCLVCQKPMCSKCMEVFGYVCSGYCKGKAENQGIAVPVYAGQKAVSQSRETQWLGKALAGFFLLFALVMGAWGWYAWVGSVPKVVSSVRFDQIAHSGQLHMAGPNQAVFLHGGRLIRHDFKTKQEVWSVLLYDEKQVIEEATTNYQKHLAERQKIIREGGEVSGDIGTLEEAVDYAKRDAASQFHLHAHGEVIWVSSLVKLTRYDWQSGKSTQELTLEAGEKRRLISNGEELIVVSAVNSLVRINLLNGETRAESLATGGGAAGGGAAARSQTNTVTRAGVPADPARSRPLTPQERALKPALSAISANQQRLAGESRDSSAVSSTSKASASQPSANSYLAVTRHGAVFVGIRELGARVIGSDSVMMHQATLRRLGTASTTEWTGEVPGYPQVYPLPSVDLLIAGKSVIAFDKTGNKKWELKLEGGVRPAPQAGYIPDASKTGEGPCVERQDVIYIVDTQGVTAFDVSTGSQRWRFAVPETESLVFDDQAGIYVNSAIPGGDRVYPVIQKIDVGTGRLIWRVEREGAIRYASRKFVYAVDSYRGDNDRDGDLPGVTTIFNVSAYVRIKRLDSETGRSLWHHIQERFPLDLRFEKNSFQILFKKEAQSLKFISL